MIRESFDYVDYLALKKSVDDNSLNPRVWQVMADWTTAQQQGGQLLRILEIGAGIGTMIERFLDGGLLSHCDYTAVELEPGFRDAAMQRLRQWAGSHNYHFEQQRPSVWSLGYAGKKIVIHWINGDATKIGLQFGPGTLDMIIGHAVVDLLPVPVCMPNILKCLSAHGGYYYSLNYAGETLFLPPLPEDQKIFQAYNNDMDRRFPGLDWQPSRTGQQLGIWLVEHGHRIIAEGDSDWELQSNPDQPTNLFIANILGTIETALSGLPGLPDWLAERRQQLQSGQLKFHASNRDYFGLTGEG